MVGFMFIYFPLNPKLGRVSKCKEKDMKYQVNVREIVSWFGLNSVSCKRGLKGNVLMG